MKVCFLQRKSRKGDFSIELCFGAAIRALSPYVECELAISKYHINVLFKRLYIIVEACFRQGDIYHVTGDIHYVTYLLRKRRTLLTIHDCGLLERRSRLRTFLYQFLWIYLPAKRSGVVSVVSQTTRDELLRLVPLSPEKLKIIPPSVSAEFAASPKAFDVKKPKILQVGTRQNKNVVRLIRALEGLPCHLILVGELNAEHRAELENCHIEHNNFRDLTLGELVRLYEESDLVTFVSLREGFGMPIIEANAVGRAVVTSNISSMPEVAGDAACLVDPFDVASIRQGIDRVIHDHPYRAKLIENGYVNCARFQPEVAARAYLEAYSHMVSQPPQIPDTTQVKL
jgi:glycosyltransferase involved in cell wall biosynthesis